MKAGDATNAQKVSSASRFITLATSAMMKIQIAPSVTGKAAGMFVFTANRKNQNCTTGEI